MKITSRLLAYKMKSGGILRMDKLQIRVRAGVGGQGIPHRGGIGGQGGDVIIKATDSTTLMELKRRNPDQMFFAPMGHHSRKLGIYGEKGNDLVVKVPVGVCVYDNDGNLLAELNEKDEEFLADVGGGGGGPDNGFKPQKPPVRVLNLDLKLMADIGFVGFPNAGKSTLLKAMSNAKPKIAAYPFTTVKPQLGMLSFPDARKISLVDLPGLIEGAHKNVGMGCEFLKHIERNLLHLFVADLNGFQLKPSEPFYSAAESVWLLNREIELYDADLIDKPAILVVNKVDSDEENDKFELVKEQIVNPTEYMKTLPDVLRPTRLLKFRDILPISAKKNRNIDALKQILRTALDDCYEPESDPYTRLGSLSLYDSRQNVKPAPKRSKLFL